MLAQAWVGVLVQVRAVKVIQAVRIFGKVRRYPVQEHANAMLVAVVHKVHEVGGRAKATGRRIIACGLVAPRAVIRMLADRQQFNVRVA